MAAWILTGLRGAVFALATAGAMATGAVAQESTNRVATKTDWSVFTEENPQMTEGFSHYHEYLIRFSIVEHMYTHLFLKQ